MKALHKPGNKSSILRLVQARETGTQRCLKRYTQLPSEMMRRISGENHRIPECVQLLAEALASRDLKTCSQIVRRCVDELADHSGAEQREGVTPNSPQRDCFLLFGGPHILVTVLQVPVDGEPERLVMGWTGVTDPSDEWELRRECMQLLRDLCYSTPPLSEQLCTHDQLLIFLFSLMRHKATFDEAISLTEEILAFRGEVFSLVTIPDVEGLIEGFKKRQLAFFCRVLALLVFESDEKASSVGNGGTSGGGGSGTDDVKIASVRDLLSARREQALSPSVKNTDRNHAVLLAMPVLLPRLVALLTPPGQCSYSRHAEEGLAHLQGGWNLGVGMLAPALEDEGWEDPPAPPTRGAGGAAGLPGGVGGAGGGGAEAMQNLALLTHQVEVLFVLCTLLAGKRKAEVQERLMGLGLVGALGGMLERMDWRRPPAAPLERIHGPGCECNPESALRIQLLRLMHNLCDREFDHGGLKLQLLSPAELASAEAQEGLDRARQVHLLSPPHAPASPSGAGGAEGPDELDHYSIRYPGTGPEGGDAPGRLSAPEAPPHAAAAVLPAARRACLNTRRAQTAVGRGSSKCGAEGDGGPERGLVMRILQVFMGEAPDSTYRFWLASCLESFLRGADPRAQVVLARGGLLEHLVRGVQSGQCSGNLQTNFDLLGELVKCNGIVFSMLNRFLDHKTYPAFMQVVVSNLVDSNVFLRAVVLSLEFFQARRPLLQELGCDYDVEACKLRRFLQHNSLRLLRDLMTVVTVEDVNQENICCLNTALALFIFAEARGDLRRYVSALRAWELRNPHSRSVTRNFLSLLRFWEEYYVYRGKDCLSLEFSSSLHFSQWRRIVATLAALLAPLHPASPPQLPAPPAEA